jgi:hypothetical protein
MMLLSAVPVAAAVVAPSIVVVEPDTGSGQLHITGAGFGTTPTVTLSGVELVVVSATDSSSPSFRRSTPRRIN